MLLNLHRTVMTSIHPLRMLQLTSHTQTHTHARTHSPIVMIMVSVLLPLGSGGQHKLLNGL